MKSNFILIVACLFSAACDRQPQPAPTPSAPKAGARSAPRPRDQGVNPNTAEHGPIPLQALTAAQKDRVRALQNVFVEVDAQGLDQRVDAFSRDAVPERELARWETMARAYTAYCSRRMPPLAAKREVYKVVMWRSLMPEKDVLERVDRGELKALTRGDVQEILRGF
jgi:hypothetical protein